ncbi:hypothetical protein SAPIO_CDS6647 [Scedosporium apiospermum]|uniref:Uncharacterized protein n=1 Tax=Pseudallescheria apiosperma TaxID=563466 RepID=A0A084G3C9_PSEDA|nr:uncharacterized protein SAPIO_CDS6647 [Scedosporium apiospermum]KEZ41841.1 hypothetical protein SAPIO_CDS6647 [Scedosporium apiospermum]
MATSLSTGGGFYKYRCKYFYTKSCQNWVYVNGEACMQCLQHHGKRILEEDHEANPFRRLTAVMPMSMKTMT